MKNKILLLSLLCMMGTVQAKKLFVTCHVHGYPAIPLGAPYTGGDVKFEMAPKKMTVNGLPARNFSASSVLWNATPQGKIPKWYKYNSNTDELFHYMKTKTGANAFLLIDNQCKDSGKTYDPAVRQAKQQQRLANQVANPGGGSDVIDNEQPPTN